MVRRLTPYIFFFFTALIAFAGGGNESDGMNFLLDVAGLENLLESEDVIVLDIRDEITYRQGHIPGAELVPLNRVEDMGGQYVAQNRAIVTYCSCPAEESSLSAAITLRDLGADRVYVLQGGYRAWSRERKPIVKGSDPS